MSSFFTPLMTFVVLYMLINVVIGVYAARKVKSTADYVIAGRSLPMVVTIATVFATWFGSETVLGIPSTFISEGGLAGIVSDPFGASLCLILAGLIFAKPLYRMKLLTIGDFYRRRYGRTIEVMVSIAICLSYLGWVSAQIMALGLVFDVLSNGAISTPVGMVIGMAIVLAYTLFGGMFSVALTDFVHMIFTVLGLAVIAFLIGNQAGGPAYIVDHARAAEMLNIMPDVSWIAIIGFIGALLTMGFGSIPQQDVFQRIMSAKNENVAKNGTIIGGVLYFLFAFIPIYIVYATSLIDPANFGVLLESDSQKLLPVMILTHTPLWIQVVFFGALLSAIMSCASATLLAPSVTFAENIMKGVLPRMTDKQMLLLIRGTVVGFAGFITLLALNSNLSIYEMVESAYKITLAAAFVPLVAGVFWKRANTAGALLSIIFGVSIWLLCEKLYAEAAVPPQMVGFLAAVVGMLVGSFVGKKNDSVPGPVSGDVVVRSEVIKTPKKPAKPQAMVKAKAKPAAKRAKK